MVSAPEKGLEPTLDEACRLTRADPGGGYGPLVVLRRVVNDPEVVLFEQRARVEQIVGVLIRYGVADLRGDAQEHRWLVRLAGDAKPDPALVSMSRGERLCAAVQELGTVFVKIGQIPSTRADLVGADTAQALQVLQADDPADTPE